MSNTALGDVFWSNKWCSRVCNHGYTLVIFISDFKA